MGIKSNVERRKSKGSWLIRESMVLCFGVGIGILEHCTVHLFRKYAKNIFGPDCKNGYHKFRNRVGCSNISQPANNFHHPPNQPLLLQKMSNTVFPFLTKYLSFGFSPSGFFKIYLIMFSLNLMNEEIRDESEADGTRTLSLQQVADLFLGSFMNAVEVATFPIYYPTMAFVNLCRYAKKKLNGK
jgi:hypothetical protein